MINKILLAIVIGLVVLGGQHFTRKDVHKELKPIVGQIKPSAAERQSIIQSDLASEQEIYNQELKSISEKIKNDPENDILIKQRIDIYLQMGLVHRAISDRSKIIEIYPTAKNYFERAKLYVLNSQPIKALNDYNLAASMDENNQNIYNNRGLLYFNNKKYKESIVDFDKAISIDDKNFKFYYNRGNAYYQLEEYSKSLLDYEQAILYSDELDINILYRKAVVLYRTSKFKLALVDCNKLIELDPSQARFYELRSFIHNKLGNEEEAIIDTEKFENLSMDELL